MGTRRIRPGKVAAGVLAAACVAVAPGIASAGAASAGAGIGSAGAGVGSAGADGSPVAGPSSGCALGPQGAIKHVIYLAFDNTHFRRDNPNVPSDIEQMPALLHFMESNGTVLSNDHTPLIAHTADDFVTSLTGEYPNNQGIPEANSYNYYEPNGTTDEAGSFGYWTDPVDSYSTANGLGIGDRTPNMLTSAGKMAPAPWVPFTRSGCDVGDVAMANTELENAVPDVPDVFGQNSPQAKDAENPKYPTQTEFEGLSVHCTKGGAFCTDNSHSVADKLPDEPGGYLGYKAVFGAKYLDGELSKGPLTNLDGQVIEDSSGNPGFPGYDSMEPVNALAYTLDMQEHGIPVTYTYLTDAHDNNTTGDGMGPGMPAYEAQLKSYNAAFAKFFTQLSAHGINKSNTLFVFGEDENDHYVGSKPTPANCNGVTVTCSYQQLGEVDANLQALLAKEEGVTTRYSVHSDSAPFVYLNGQPGRTTPTVRAFGRALARLTAVDPYRSKTVKLTNYLADPVELKVLHMITADPKRTPTFAMFANPDFYLYNGGPTCPTSTCESYDSAVWNHGDLSPDINRSWMAFVGPGVKHLGTSDVWASETDTRPTLMSLLHLTDDYTHEGRVLTQIMDRSTLPPALRGRSYQQLADAYTQIESPVGPFGLATLALSTHGIASGTAADDSTYTADEAIIATLGKARDAVGSAMIRLLEGAAFHGQPIPGSQTRPLVRSADGLIGRTEVDAFTR
ncbi:MAG TPA: hypothetical protein VKV06_03440 [Acidimicrobiales bacterium]|nr:hypothetical protein [Acidimicrobiales bacterium]